MFRQEQFQSATFALFTWSQKNQDNFMTIPTKWDGEFENGMGFHSPLFFRTLIRPNKFSKNQIYLFGIETGSSHLLQMSMIFAISMCRWCPLPRIWTPRSWSRRPFLIMAMPVMNASSPSWLLLGGCQMYLCLANIFGDFPILFCRFHIFPQFIFFIFTIAAHQSLLIWNI